MAEEPVAVPGDGSPDDGREVCFTTRQVGVLLGEEEHTVRFWSQAFAPFLPGLQAAAGRPRRYRLDHIVRLGRIRKLLREGGLSIQQAREAVEKEPPAPGEGFGLPGTAPGPALGIGVAELVGALEQWAEGSLQLKRAMGEATQHALAKERLGEALDRLAREQSVLNQQQREAGGEIQAIRQEVAVALEAREWRPVRIESLPPRPYRHWWRRLLFWR